MVAEQIVLNKPYLYGNCQVKVRSIDGEMVTIQPMADRFNWLTPSKNFNVKTPLKSLSGKKLCKAIYGVEEVEPSSKFRRIKFFPKKLNVSNLREIGEGSTRYDKNLVYSKRLDLKHKFRLPVKDTEGNACILELLFEFNKSFIHLQGSLMFNDLINGIKFEHLQEEWLKQFAYAENTIYEFLYDLLENRVKADTVDDKEAIRVSKNLVAMCKTYAEQLGVKFEKIKPNPTNSLLELADGTISIVVDSKAKLETANVFVFGTYSNEGLKWEAKGLLVEVTMKIKPFTVTIGGESVTLYQAALPKSFYKLEDGVNVLYKNMGSTSTALIFKSPDKTYAMFFGNKDVFGELLKTLVNAKLYKLEQLLGIIADFAKNYIK